MLIFLPAALAGAFADTAQSDAEPCGGETLSASQPQTGATGVPVDVHPVLWFETGSCAARTWTTGLYGPDKAEILLLTETSLENGILELVPPEELLPESAYTIVVTPTDGSGQEVRLGFTTGTGRVAEATAPPTIRSLTAEAWVQDVDLVFEAVVAPTAADDGLSRIGLHPEQLDAPTAWVPLSGAPEVLATTSWYFPEPGVEGCVLAVQVDGAGRALSSEPACLTVTADPTTPDADAATCGCTSTSSPAGILGLLAATLLGRRRTPG